MKRTTGLLFACLALAGSAWVAHVVWGQATETKPAEKTITITKSQFDKYVADAVAAERERSGHDKPATDEQVLDPHNWHKAIFNKAEFVIYTGPGQFMFHHWIDTGAKSPAAKSPAAKPAATKPPAAKSGDATEPAPKGG